jgi:hypothetical protein
MLYHSTSFYNKTPYCVNLTSNIVLPLGPGSLTQYGHTYNYNIEGGECTHSHLVYTTSPETYYNNHVSWDGKVYSV